MSIIETTIQAINNYSSSLVVISGALGFITNTNQNPLISGCFSGTCFVLMLLDSQTCYSFVIADL
ncbi:hypothetical protein TSUD_92060 [Trifolium subterraneum]|uniref:Uncharacterized protein n=1 Tax=Trifolium subterraneum TaxID=3900 RepID=A0A2Z6P5R6_TRISU|nr:hypothetical protein TSUD_92060 [Trifolium subterraneum]